MAGRGKGWEKELEAQAVEARERGHHAARCYSEAKAVEGRLIYSAKGPCDFMGWVMAHNVAFPIVFDAKEFRGDALRFKDIRSHQAMQMLACHRGGGVSGVLAKCDAGRFVVPWVRFAALYQAWAAGGAKGVGASVPVEDFGSVIRDSETWLDRVATYAQPWW